MQVTCKRKKLSRPQFSLFKNEGQQEWSSIDIVMKEGAVPSTVLVYVGYQERFPNMQRFKKHFTHLYYCKENYLKICVAN